MADCNKFLKHIPYFEEVGLSIEEKTSFENHLLECPKCSKLYLQVMDTYKLLEAEETIELSPFFTEKVLTSLETRSDISFVKWLNGIIFPSKYRLAYAVVVISAFVFGIGLGKFNASKKQSLDNPFAKLFQFNENEVGDLNIFFNRNLNKD